jgi:hypothetical protein
MKEEVIVTTVEITLPGEIKNFQVRLPQDAKWIIGIEASFTLIYFSTPWGYFDPEFLDFPFPNDPLFKIKSVKTIGEIALQTLGKENIFYKDEIKEKDSNIFWSDFSNPASNHFQEWTHARRKEEMEVSVQSNSIVEVCYKDRMAPDAGFNVNYFLKLYLWLKKIM